METFRKLVTSRYRVTSAREADAAPPSPNVSGARWYHGTPTEKQAEKIWNEGIRPNLSTERGLSRAVDDMVYATKDLRYAINYALGANVAGDKSDWKDRLIEKYGRYGYMAVIPGSELKNVHPDEDQIGEAIYHAYKDRNAFGWLKDLAEKYLYVSPVEGDEDQYPDLLSQVKDGDYDAYIKAGKILMSRLDDEETIAIIEKYGNVAHEGVLKPSELWRIDRAKIPDLKKDGSNFFQIAERVK